MLSIKEAGVFLSKADTDTLLKTVPRNPGGDLAYHTMLDSIIGKSERRKGVWRIEAGGVMARLQAGMGGGVDARPNILSPLTSPLFPRRAFTRLICSASGAKGVPVGRRGDGCGRPEPAWNVTAVLCARSQHAEVRAASARGETFLRLTLLTEVSGGYRHNTIRAWAQRRPPPTLLHTDLHCHQSPAHISHINGISDFLTSPDTLHRPIPWSHTIWHSLTP